MGLHGLAGATHQTAHLLLQHWAFVENVLIKTQISSHNFNVSTKNK